MEFELFWSREPVKTVVAGLTGLARLLNYITQINFFVMAPRDETLRLSRCTLVSLGEMMLLCCQYLGTTFLTLETNPAFAWVKFAVSTHILVNIFLETFHIRSFKFSKMIKTCNFCFQRIKIRSNLTMNRPHFLAVS